MKTQRDQRNDPATAPLVPVHSSLTLERDLKDHWVDYREQVIVSEGDQTVTVVFAAWDRKTGQVGEYTVVAKNADVTFVQRPPTLDDVEWLRNIGATS